MGATAEVAAQHRQHQPAASALKEYVDTTWSRNSSLVMQPADPSCAPAGFRLPQSNAFGQAFRAYDAESERRAGVQELYRLNHIHQTFAFGQEMRRKHLALDKAVMGIWECCELLNDCVDDSDPDLEEPQIQHLLQTAEAIRMDHPHDDWFHLTGLIHGDTFPVGCAFDPAIVHADWFKDNADAHNPVYHSKLGIYKEACGLDNVVMSWGHDEYMHQVIKRNNSTLPPQALFVVRYHSFYALHRSGAYKHLMDGSDHANLPWLEQFNKYDLYSKSKVRIDVDNVKPYYLALIHKEIVKDIRLEAFREPSYGRHPNPNIAFQTINGHKMLFMHHF